MAVCEIARSEKGVSESKQTYVMDVVRKLYEREMMLGKACGLQ